MLYLHPWGLMLALRCASGGPMELPFPSRLLPPAGGLLRLSFTPSRIHFSSLLVSLPAILPHDPCTHMEMFRRRRGRFPVRCCDAKADVLHVTLVRIDSSKIMEEQEFGTVEAALNPTALLLKTV